MGMLVEAEVVVMAVWRNVVVDSLVEVVTDELADILMIGACADIMVGASDGSDVGIIVVAAAVIALEIVVPVLCTTDVLAGMVFRVLVNVLHGVLAGVIRFLPRIGVDTLAKVNFNVSAAVT